MRIRARSMAAEFGPTVATRHAGWVDVLGAAAVSVSPRELRTAVAEYEARQALERELATLGRGGVVDGRVDAVATAG